METDSMEVPRPSSQLVGSVITSKAHLEPLGCKLGCRQRDQHVRLDPPLVPGIDVLNAPARWDVDGHDRRALASW